MYNEKYYPFYMNFTTPEFWEEERLQERENQLMQSLYPRTARKIQQKVSQECDRIDYPGSILYDEYPDKFMMDQLCRKIRTDMENEDMDGMKPDYMREERMGEDRMGEARMGEDYMREDRMGEDRMREDRMGEDHMGEDRMGENYMEAEQRYDRRNDRRHDRKNDNLLDELIHVLLFQEMRRRRCRNNRCRRYF